MKKLLSIFALVASLGLGLAANTYAEDAAPAAEAAAVVAPAADAAAPAAAAPAAAPAAKAEPAKPAASVPLRVTVAGAGCGAAG